MLEVLNSELKNRFWICIKGLKPNKSPGGRSSLQLCGSCEVTLPRWAQVGFVLLEQVPALGRSPQPTNQLRAFYPVLHSSRNVWGKGLRGLNGKG